MTFNSILRPFFTDFEVIGIFSPTAHFAVRSRTNYDWGKNERRKERKIRNQITFRWIQMISQVEITFFLLFWVSILFTKKEVQTEVEKANRESDDKVPFKVVTRRLALICRAAMYKEDRKFKVLMKSFPIYIISWL